MPSNAKLLGMVLGVLWLIALLHFGWRYVAGWKAPHGREAPPAPSLDLSESDDSGSDNNVSGKTSNSNARPVDSEPHPGIIRSLDRTWEQRPPGPLLSDLGPADVPELRKLLVSERPLPGRRGAIWGLGYAGGADAVEALLDFLRRDRSEERLTPPEEDIVYEAVFALGVAAVDNEEAARYLREGTRPRVWKKRRTWTSQRGDWGNRLPVYYCLQALGLSGRSDVDDFLVQCRERDEVYLYDFGSSIAEAAFLLHLNRTVGHKEVRRLYNTPAYSHRFKAWAEGSGKDWVEWANATGRGPRPE